MSFQNFKIENLDTFSSDLSQLLDRQREKIAEITDSDAASYSDVLKPMQDMDEELSNFFTPLSHLNSVSNSEATQRAYEESIPLLSKFSSEMAQNVKLFTKLERMQSDNIEAQKVIDDEVKSFVLSGAKLPLDKKKRVEEISLRLSELSNQFSQNLLDATNEYELIIDDERDVEGIPPIDLESAKVTRDDKEVYRFTLQIPSYMAYMTYGVNRKYREELYRAYSTRAPQNAQVIDEILKLKSEKAKIMGYDNYAIYALQTRDASSESVVIEFLEGLASLSLEHGKKELDELVEFAKKIDGIESIASYDVAYYSEKLKRDKFDFDDSMTKPYFEQDRVLSSMLDIVSELFDVKFDRVEVDVWNEKVKVYDIYDGGRELSGRIYFDLEAREEKRGGAWMNDWETHFIDSSGKRHLATAFVVCNFSPSSEDAPSLLRHDDVVTLFHEMGHAIHHLFGKCNERSISGINGVAWDVVEFPSQFLENFAYERAILERFAYHYETKESIPKELLSKIKESKNFQASLGMLRQIEFALFDFKLHQSLYQGDEVQELLDNIRETVSPLKPPSYNKFQNGFAHIFGGGYAAGYYSYKWAEVLSADAFFECIDEESGFDIEKAKGYKRHILSNGGLKPMSQLYEEWLGKRADLKSLIKLYEIDK
ncbi:Oligopeptidase A [hydrothermal vent metagenome]|uniref:oligopeptidase A n=1 Tax=hydrothermal vent metagenome TaxID=652676 RepID=A0A1W1C5H2_9ZZZZ